MTSETHPHHSDNMIGADDPVLGALHHNDELIQYEE